MELFGEVWAWFTDPANWSGTDGIPIRTLDHIWISVFSTAIAAAIALPPAIALAHLRKGAFLASAVVNIGRAIPSFGIVIVAGLFFLQQGLGLRFWPIVVALVALALPPIFTNGYAAIASVPAAVVESARGMGLTGRQIALEIELPVGAPVLLAGLRIALIQVIATTAIGAIIGPGGALGRYIVDGFARGRAAHDEVFAGALLVALVAVGAERAFTLAERWILPRGVRRHVRTADVAETAAPA